jgi:hypothetical protein
LVGKGQDSGVLDFHGISRIFTAFSRIFTALWGVIFGIFQTFSNLSKLFRTFPNFSEPFQTFSNLSQTFSGSSATFLTLPPKSDQEAFLGLTMALTQALFT